MPQCPQCQREFIELPRQCPSCRADLDLLVDYVTELQGGLTQATRHIRSGNLGDAVWAYLSVLEIDPDNPVARRQVGEVATAVRQFDRAAPGRRWLYQMRGESVPGESNSWLRWVFVIVLALILSFVTFVLGLAIGANQGPGGSDPKDKIKNQKNDNQLTG